MKKVGTDPEGFLRSLPDAVRDTMTELDRVITSSLPGRSRAIWEGRF
ncbi:MAG: hypothetical protein WEA10_02050 [Actinomycetota bacterium]